MLWRCVGSHCRNRISSAFSGGKVLKMSKCMNLNKLKIQTWK